MLLALFLWLSMADVAVTGIVKDITGGAVPGATVIVRAPSGAEQQTVTGPDGRFRFDAAAEDGTLIVRAGGFGEKTQPVAATALEITLEPAPLRDTLVVTPTRSEERLGNIPASVNVLRSREIQQSPAVVADDVLRRIPSFSLFRRSSSFVAHPTTQGVSLRGIGPSGVSRTLVLLDGSPFNDPFGGWVYWTRVPLESADRIEVVDGSSSSIYGNYAMGGVINIVSARPSRRTLQLKTQYGNHNTKKLDVFGSDVWGNVGLGVDATVFSTDGFLTVAPGERGAIDNEAWADYGNVNVKFDYSPTDRVSLFARGGYFDENRSNGKIEEVNDTVWKSISGGVRVQMRDGSALQARLFGDIETFHSTFLAVPGTTPPRGAVRLSIDQEVPTDSFGSSAQWQKAFAGPHLVSAGVDFRRVDGDSREDVYLQAPGAIQKPIHPAILNVARVSGGTQRSTGAFIQDVFTPIEPLSITASVRVDNWRNYDAHNFETQVSTGEPTEESRELADKADTVASPRIAAIYRANNRVSVWGGVSSGFRAPTLNELYRQFRVGPVLTLANETLGPERLVLAEAGLNVALRDDLSFRATWYDNHVRNAVSNVTISTNLQQRQNLGRTRVRGFQTDVEYLFSESLRFAGAYLFNDATVSENEDNPSLVGKQLPQVPRHRGSLQIAHMSDTFANVALGVQFIGRQFDDDQNSRGVPSEGCPTGPNACDAGKPGLPGYAIADITVSRRISGNLEAFFGIQNLFDEEYYVGTNPTLIGTPRLVNGGIRIIFR